MIDEVKKLLSTKQKIIITTHQRPDGDAIGSSLGLYHFLIKKGHEVFFISPTAYPDFLKWIPGNEITIVYEDEKERCAKLVSEATLIFCLDFNKLYRLNDLGKEIEKSTAPKILIDHHLDPDDFAIAQFWNTKASSTCELVYEFILDLGEKILIDASIATCLYTGILTDTDRFRVPTTSSNVHRIVADLLEFNVDHTNVYQQIYESFSEDKLRMVGFSIREKLEVHDEIKTGIIALERNDMNRFHAQS
ncbi:MAG: DHH family phosphoesterase, partial [Chitinophagales bacterium]|nr:DHH family phosphoesterase [Chitinophagales bacterium]